MNSRYAAVTLNLKTLLKTNGLHAQFVERIGFSPRSGVILKKRKSILQKRKKLDHPLISESDYKT
jgi:hypothetical protein